MERNEVRSPVSHVVVCQKIRIYTKVILRLFRPAGGFRDGLARQISAPLGSADGESTGDPPVALAPWPARCRSRKNRVSFAGHPSGSAGPSRRRETRSLGEISSKKKAQSITHIYPMNSDVLYDSSRSTPQVDLTRESYPSMCPHHAATVHAGRVLLRSTQRGCQYETTHGVAVSYEFICYVPGRSTLYSSREGTSTTQNGSTEHACT